MRMKDTGRYILLLACAASLGACNKDAQSASNDNARQIELPPSPPAQPELNDVAKPEPPVAKAPSPPPKPAPEKRKAPEAKAPEPSKIRVVRVPQPDAAAPSAGASAAGAAPAGPPEQVFGVITSGSALSVTPVARICTDLYQVGDRTTATLDATVQGVDGAVLPMGSTVTLRITASQRGKGSDADAKIAFELLTVKVGDETYNAVGHLTSPPPIEKTRQQSTGDQAKKVGVGALIGAIAGQLLGKNTKSTVAGAVVGGAAGAAVAAGTADYDACVTPGGHIQLQLDRPLTVRLSQRNP